jgi:hypothetical protein
VAVRTQQGKVNEQWEWKGSPEEEVALICFLSKFVEMEKGHSKQGKHLDKGVT